MFLSDYLTTINSQPLFYPLSRAGAHSLNYLSLFGDGLERFFSHLFFLVLGSGFCPIGFDRGTAKNLWLTYILCLFACVAIVYTYSRQTKCGNKCHYYYHYSRPENSIIMGSHCPGELMLSLFGTVTL